MIYFFCWGETFLARFAEFWPAQIARILQRARRLFRRRPRHNDLEAAAQIRASIIPFEMYGYGLVLVLNGDVWTLEIAEFPPHAKPGQRIRRARRQRERQEKKAELKRQAQARRELRAAARAAELAAKRAAKDAAKEAKRLAKAAKQKARKEKKRGNKEGKATDSSKRIIAVLFASFGSKISMLYNTAEASCEKFKQACLGFVAFGDQTKIELDAEPLTVRQQLSRWIAPSTEDCRNANIAAWKQDPLPRGAPRERRLFCPDFLPMWLDTIATPLESMFVRDGRSLFGELFLESECVS